MRKKLITVISILCVIFSCVGLSGCKFFKKPDAEPTPGNTGKTLINGGFESADLSGWTVEYGDAFDDDCVSSQKTFMIANDANTRSCCSSMRRLAVSDSLANLSLSICSSRRS